MEILIIFILFIVFSAIRSAAESQKQQNAQQAKGTPAHPVQPAPVPLPQQVDPSFIASDAEFTYEDSLTDRDDKMSRREQAPPTFTKEAPPVDVLKPSKKRKTHRMRKQQEFFQNSEELVRGIILSEILGPPRAFRRHGHRRSIQ